MTPNAASSPLFPALLATALDLTHDLLYQVSLTAALPDYWVTAFGSEFDGSTAQEIAFRWQNQDFSQFPDVEVLSTDAMQGAIGGYSQDTNKIYLSAALVNQYSVAKIRDVLLEEYGHFLDAQINVADTPVDEGEIWRNLVLGQPMDQELLATLRQENDWGTVTVDGQNLAVERALIVLTVNTTFDDNDGSASLGTGLSLRDAIIIANNNAANDYIIDLASGGTYFLTQSANSDTQFVGDLDIFSGANVTVRTIGSTPATINASTLVGSGDRIFEVGGGGTLTLNKVVITGGANNSGGGINNGGTLNLFQTTIKNNSGYYGGGIINNGGTLNIVQSTINDNFSVWGGGIYGRATITISSSTISGNSADAGGGGIYSYGNTLLINTTVANNTADADNNDSSGRGGGIFSSGSGLSLRNTIVAGNFDNPGSSGSGTKNPDISGSVQGNAYNLISDLTGASGTIGTGSDLAGANANLGPLAFNGGPTQTHALLAGSAAINAGLTVLIGTDLGDSDGDGNTAEPIPFDQRGAGYFRVSGSSVDIGAFEEQQAIFTLAHTAYNNVNSMWSVKSGSLVSSYNLPSWAGWKPVALGDFTWDGQTDVVMTQPTTGYNLLWALNQGQYSWYTGMPSWGKDWQIKDAADFNGDGQTDLLINNPTQGWNAIWTMSGTTYTGYRSASFWKNWNAVAAGDMNNDGIEDILVRYGAEGWNAVHLMDAQGGLASTEILPGWGKDWVITGTTDVNGDGKTDIIVNNPYFGWNVYWTMDGTTQTSYGAFPGAPGAQFLF